MSLPVLSDYLEKLDQVLQDTNEELDPDIREALVNEAVKMYSAYRPLEKVDRVTGDDSYTYDLPTDWEDGFSSIKSIEYPADEQTPTILAESTYQVYRSDTGLKLRFLVATPSTLEDYLITYFIRHSVAAGAGTIPESDVDAVVNLIASLACTAIGRKYNQDEGGDTIDVGSEKWRNALRYTEKAKELMDLYLQFMGLGPITNPAAIEALADQAAAESSTTDPYAAEKEARAVKADLRLDDNETRLDNADTRAGNKDTREATAAASLEVRLTADELRKDAQEDRLDNEEIRKDAKLVLDQNADTRADSKDTREATAAASLEVRLSAQEVRLDAGEVRAEAEEDRKDAKLVLDQNEDLRAEANEDRLDGALAITQADLVIRQAEEARKAAEAALVTAADTVLDTLLGVLDNLLEGGPGDLQTLNAETYLQEAVQVYSKHRPLAATLEITGNGTGIYDLPDDWVSGFSAITKIEYPFPAELGEEESSILDPGDYMVYETDLGLELRLLKAEPAATEEFRISYTIRHSITAEASTIPDEDTDAIITLAGALACFAMARKILTVRGSFSKEKKDYFDKGNALLEIYHQHLNRFPGISQLPASVARSFSGRYRWRN